MKAILRFKESVRDIEAGSLMVHGAELKPDPGAMHRVAQRLGVSSAALAAAQALVAKAAAESGVAATAAGTAAVGKGVASVLAVSVMKGVAIGLCVSGVAFVGARLPIAATSANPAPTMAPVTGASSKHSDSVQVLGTVTSVPVASPDHDVVVSSHRAETSLAKSGFASAAASASPTSLVGARVPEPVIDSTNTPNSAERPLPQPPGATSPIVGSPPVSGAFAMVPSASAAPADARVMQEVMSLDRARTLAKQGNAAVALRELDDFGRRWGYRTLWSEAMLVRIDVLLSLGMRDSASSVARQLLSVGAPATQRQRLTVLANAGAAETPVPASK